MSSMTKHVTISWMDISCVHLDVYVESGRIIREVITL